MALITWGRRRRRGVFGLGELAFQPDVYKGDAQSATVAAAQVGTATSQLKVSPTDRFVNDSSARIASEADAIGNAIASGRTSDGMSWTAPGVVATPGGPTQDEQELYQASQMTRGGACRCPADMGAFACFWACHSSKVFAFGGAALAGALVARMLR